VAARRDCQELLHVVLNSCASAVLDEDEGYFLYRGSPMGVRVRDATLVFNVL
jgi:hypothetical protein